MQCHWDQTTIGPIHLPRKTAITDNTGGERGREGEKQTRRDGKTGGGGKVGWRETEAGGQREKKYKERDEGSRSETDSLQSVSRSRLEGQCNWTAP